MRYDNTDENGRARKYLAYNSAKHRVKDFCQGVSEKVDETKTGFDGALISLYKSKAFNRVKAVGFGTVSEATLLQCTAAPARGSK